MSNVVIKVEGLSKQYKLGQIGTGALAHDLNRWWSKVRGKEDPYLKIGEENNRTQKSSNPYVWALDDINFQVNHGDVLGLIGRNGAGKSTLLKILSQVTLPTKGSIKVKGKIASLLEVGTGFHPELTGRENIFLNGAILGMSKQEIRKKFDAIVDFSGVERYIDTPVKRYSSGMYVRLAFAVAAHLESDILIVDEVLAVGDTEFQKKCLGKMGAVSKGEGRTVLFVSHNMSAMQKLCNTGVFLENGRSVLSGGIENIVNKYLETSEASRSRYSIENLEAESLDAYASEITIEDLNNQLINEIPLGKQWQIRVKFRLNKDVKHFIPGLGMSNSLDVNIRTSWGHPIDLQKGDYEVIFKEQQLLLAVGTYNLIIGFSSFERPIYYVENVANMTISDVDDKDLDRTVIRTTGVGVVLNPMDITVSKL